MDFKKLNEKLNTILEEIPTWAEGGPLLVPIEPEEQEIKNTQLIDELWNYCESIKHNELKWEARQRNCGLYCYIDTILDLTLDLKLPKYEWHDNELKLVVYKPTESIRSLEDLTNLGFTKVEKDHSILIGITQFNSVEECISKWKELLDVIIQGI